MRYGLFVQRATQLLGTIVKSEQYSGELEDEVRYQFSFFSFFFIICPFYVIVISSILSSNNILILMVDHSANIFILLFLFKTDFPHIRTIYPTARCST